MDKDKLIDFLERSIECLKRQKDILSERLAIIRLYDESEFVLENPVSKYQNSSAYVGNIKKLKIADLEWEILSVEDKINGYEAQIEMTKNAKEK